MIVRAATPADAEQMCVVLNPLIAAGGTTALREPFDAARMTTEFIAPDTRVACTVAETEGSIVGFQSLVWAQPAYETLPADWAVIATFARIEGNRRGVGRALFARTLEEARRVGVSVIDATIRKENTGGQIFYDKLGFVDWTEGPETVSKRYDVQTPTPRT